MTIQFFNVSECVILFAYAKLDPTNQRFYFVNKVYYKLYSRLVNRTTTGEFGLSRMDNSTST